MVSTPSAPDPYATASAQQTAETGAANSSSVMNNPNIINPYGSQTYTISGYEQVPDANGNMISVPRYTQTQTLSPDQQQLYELETQAQHNLGQTAVEQSAFLQDYLGTMIDPNQWEAWDTGPAAPKLSQNYRQDQAPTDRASIEQAMMDLYNSEASEKNAAEQAQLAARGMNTGSSQYGSTLERQGDEFTDATLQAYLTSGDEARAAQDAYNQVTAMKNATSADQFNLSGSAADRTNALRGMQSAETFALRNQPINEISALMSGAQVSMPTFPGYQGQSINAANIGSYINNAYNQEMAAASAANTGLFNLASAGLTAASDRRLKKDIKPIRAMLAGLPLYLFRYRFDPGVIQVGVMADEARILHPQAVKEIDGYDHVDYGMLRQLDKSEGAHA